VRRTRGAVALKRPEEALKHVGAEVLSVQAEDWRGSKARCVRAEYASERELLAGVLIRWGGSRDVSLAIGGWVGVARLKTLDIPKTKVVDQKKTFAGERNQSERGEGRKPIPNG